ncbi:MAG TPA: sigma-70 family RNA polymerase sigma factor [Caulobacteraceae bacterium]|jgi:RNA polymerase sigma-70 factor (ECF subfamily)
MSEAMTDEAAHTLRRLWFAFLEEIAPARPRLHAYCLRLTGSIFDAEDLVQESLIRAFGAIGQGDLAGGPGPTKNVRAYLSRIATNIWIDTQRRAKREAAANSLMTAEAARDPAVVTPAAGAALFERAAPQERAAVVLKDVFDFSLEEIATILSTSPGAVKSALARGRGKLAEKRSRAARVRGTPASAELVDRFCAAVNARDVKALTALLTEDVAYEARGVGGETGRDAIWIAVNMTRPREEVTFERHVIEGQPVSVGVHTSRSGRRFVAGVSRFEEAEGQIARHVGYYFCPETLVLVGEALGMEAANHGYHQTPDVLERMIGGARLPWNGL